MRFLKFLVLSLLILPLFAVSAAAQYSVEAIGACSAPGVSDSVKAALEDKGYRVKDASGEYVDVWLAKSIPAPKGDAPGGADFTIPPATLVGVIQYAKEGGDFRGQKIKAGVYTMRYNLQPEDGDHQGTAPRRDFVLLNPVAGDQDAGAKLNFDQASALSKKASGTNHPLVLFLMLPDSGAQYPGVAAKGSTQVLDVQSGAVQLGITIVGKAEG